MIEITDREAEALSIHLEYMRRNRPDQPIGRTLEALADRLYRLTIFKIIVEETIEEGE